MRSRPVIARVVIILGAAMVLFSIALAAFCLVENAKAAEGSDIVLSTLHSAVPGLSRGAEAMADETAGNSGTGMSSPSAAGRLPDPLSLPFPPEMPVINVGGCEYIGVIAIPALGLELPVAAEFSYQQLTVSPCRFSGSAYSGGLVVAAHNYPSHFGAINSLSPGDRVLFTDADGNVFEYSVCETELLNPGETAELKDQAWGLTLFTCTPAGSRRVTVRCV